MIKNIDHNNVIHYGTDAIIIKSVSTGSGKPVCKKILMEEFPAAELVAELENEFEICSKIKGPGIRKAYKKIKEEDHHAIELEFIEGTDLNKFLAAEKPDLLQQLNLSVALVTALTDIHRENIFFRQVHPSNMLIEQPTQKIFFIDFGLATYGNGYEPAQLPAHEKQVEYLKYISPEQTGRINRAIDNRADLYSVGVILYRLFTGLLPFESKDSLELIYAHVAKEPPDPCLLNKELPEVIAGIIRKLLSKNAEDRYQSAFGLKADLEICLKKFITNKKIEKFELAEFDFTGKLNIPSTLFGREKETEKIHNLFASATQGTKITLLISGLPGCGKSSLVDTLHPAVIKKKGFLIKGKFDQINRAKPYSTFVQSFGELIHIILTGEKEKHLRLRRKITASLGNSLKILPKFIAGLEDLTGKVTQLPQLKNKEFENQVNYEFIRFLKTLSDKDHPLILFVDDLQWAD
ncbi:MAG TPA: serine/threonine-protein kinase, partial [Chitinophagaceae bacterium]|nr:serine/threonine-protein kinase [Chitinophagaceae bacterium]